MISSFYQIIKPERTYANVITATAGYLFASSGTSLNLSRLIYTLVGMALVIASACVANNILDRNLDQKMSRTKKRALVRGDVSTEAAKVYAAVLGLAGFLILGLAVNSLVVILGLIGYVDYVILYGLSKRTSSYSTLIGSLSGAMSIVAGYCAVTDQVDANAVILFLILAFWQMPHFYAIGIYRLNDYKKGKLPVWPVVKGVEATKRQIVLFTSLFVVACVSLTLFGTASFTYMLAALVLGVWWLIEALNGLGLAKSKNRQWSRRFFGSSLIVLTLLCLSIAFL